MRQLVLVVMAALWSGSMSLAIAQNDTANPGDTGERLIAVNTEPSDEAVDSQDAESGSETKESEAKDRQDGKASDDDSKEAPEVATNIEGKLVRTNMPFSHTPGKTALEKANYERRRNGVGALKPDPALQKLALKKARIAASRRYKNHIGGSLGRARAEGVGHTQGRFLSCCLDMHATYGGAAMVKGADGWYCCLLVR